ncbi:MAG: AAA family ATPase [Chitinophagales bacterium]
MEQNSPFIITISRQAGSGGSYLGQKLAKRLGLLYVDRETVKEVAKKLEAEGEGLENREEKVTGFWQSVIQSFRFAPDIYTPPILMPIPTDQQMFRVESDVIRYIAKKQSAVIVGRGGSYILQTHPNHVSVFLHANHEYRTKRVQEVYELSAQEANKTVDNSDRDRSRYFHALTGRDWSDARQYHISLDTFVLGMDKAEEIIVSYIQTRFGELSLSQG